MLLSDQSRLLALVIGCAVLWTVETWLPLYRYEPRRWRRALPNVVLTSLLVLTNLARLQYGLDGFDVRSKQTLLALIRLPFQIDSSSSTSESLNIK
jgi:hypothetical protein